MDESLSELQELVMDRRAGMLQFMGVSKSRTWLSDWTKLNWADVGNLISGSSAFSKTSLNIRKFMVHVLLKPGLENFEHYFTSVWDECSCAIVWALFSIAFLCYWNENWPFPVVLFLILFWKAGPALGNISDKVFMAPLPPPCLFLDSPPSMETPFFLNSCFQKPHADMFYDEKVSQKKRKHW